MPKWYCNASSSSLSKLWLRSMKWRQFVFKNFPAPLRRSQATNSILDVSCSIQVKLSISSEVFHLISRTIANWSDKQTWPWPGTRNCNFSFCDRCVTIPEMSVKACLQKYTTSLENNIVTRGDPKQNCLRFEMCVYCRGLVSRFLQSLSWV